MGGSNKTEYGKQFSPKRSMLSVQQSRVYEDNVGYREYRRKLENWHSHDPFAWDYNSPSGVGRSSGRSSSSSSYEEVKQPGPSHKEDECRWRRRDEGNQTPMEWVEEDDVTLPKTPPIRRKTAPPRLHKKNLKQKSSQERNPFLTYGTGFKGIETGDKRSYNVYAQGSPNAAALRAQRRREADILWREERKKKAPLKIRREEALFNEKVTRETERWQTEYSSHYPAHSRQEYERNLSALKLGGVKFDT